MEQDPIHELSLQKCFLNLENWQHSNSVLLGVLLHLVTWESQGGLFTYL